MATKPATQPRWADGGGALITTPSSGAQDVGHVPDTAPAAQLFNWFWNLVYLWIAFFDAITQSVVTKFGAATVSATSVRQAADVLQYRAELAAIHSTIQTPLTFSVGCADTATDGSTHTVAVGRSSGEIYSSANMGLTWTSRTPAASFSGAWYGVIWSSGLSLFIAVGDGTIQTSPDGITWTQRVSNAGIKNQTIIEGGGLLVSTGWDSGTTFGTYTSSNGTAWTHNTSGIPHLSTRTLAYANGLFVSPSDDSASTAVYTSPDGATWTTRAWGSSSTMLCLQMRWVPVAGYFVAIGITGGNRELQQSTSGTTWTQVRVAAGSSPGGIIATDVAAFIFYGDQNNPSWSWLNGECTAAMDFTTPIHWGSAAGGVHVRVLQFSGRTRAAIGYASNVSPVVVTYFAASAA